jgi:hypothetical protein
MERARDRSSTPGHPEAGGQEGIANDPSWQETLPRACDATAPAPVLSLVFNKIDQALAAPLDTEHATSLELPETAIA